LETIINYLKNPMEVGIHRYLFIIDFSKFSDYFNELYENYKATRGKTSTSSIQKQLFENSLERLKDAKDKFTKKKPIDKEYFEILQETFLSFCAMSPDITEETKNVFTQKFGTHGARFPKTKNIFKSHMLPNLNDIILIEKNL